MTYPEDVQAALDHSAEVGWDIERYQAVLSLALHHLDGETEVLVSIERVDAVVKDDAIQGGTYGTAVRDTLVALGVLTPQQIKGIKVGMRPTPADTPT